MTRLFALRLLRCAVLVAVVGGRATAQGRDTTGVLSGVVLDSLSRPVVDAEVVVTSVARTTRTDASGAFRLDRLLVGPTRVLVRRIGWIATDSMIDVTRVAVAPVRIVLSRTAQQLGRVLITAPDECPNRTFEGFACRRRSGRGVFRDSSDLAALKPVFVADLLWGVDGLRRIATPSGPSIESTTGWRCLRRIINGMPPGTARGSNDPGDFVGVEFYADPADVPAWYKSFAIEPGTPGRRGRQLPTGGYAPGVAGMPARSCALIVYWMKDATRFDPSLDPSASVTRARGVANDSARAGKRP